jgi:hypothetical protein
VYDALVSTMIRNFGLSRRPLEPQDGNIFVSTERHEGGPGRWGRARVGLVAGVAATVALSAGRAAWSMFARR